MQSVDARFGLGGNGGPTFDDIVRETLERGLLLAVKEVIVQAIRDPRLDRRHLRMLAEIVDVINSKSGVAFPGRRTLAERTGYTEASVAKTISELIAFGYLISCRRQVEQGGRALAHYALRRPTREEVEDEINRFISAQRGGPKSTGWKPTWGGDVAAEVTPVGNVTQGANVTPVGNLSLPNVTPVGNVSSADVTPVGNLRIVKTEADVTPLGNVVHSNVTPVVPTVTSSKKVSSKYHPPTPLDPDGRIEVVEELVLQPTDEDTVAAERRRKAAARTAAETAQAKLALAAYNAAAELHGWTQAITISDGRQNRLIKRLADLKGLANFELAIKGVLQDDFLMGRTLGRDGAKPFKLDLDRLLQTDGGLGDVLAKSLDRAIAKGSGGPWYKNSAKLAAMTEDRWRKGLREHANGIWPVDKLGPPPGRPDCVVPRHIVDDLGLTKIYDERGLKR